MAGSSNLIYPLTRNLILTTSQSTKQILIRSSSPLIILSTNHDPSNLNYGTVNLRARRRSFVAVKPSLRRYSALANPRKAEIEDIEGERVLRVEKKVPEPQPLSSSVTPSTRSAEPSTASPTPPSSSPSSPSSGPQRPTISFSHVPWLPPSPLNESITPYPPLATSALREAIADFLSSESLGHVQPPSEELILKSKDTFLNWRVTWWRAKQLFRFYWEGCKALGRNVRDWRRLREGERKEGWVLTRREIGFIERTKGDMVRIIPFVLLLVTLEEALPLLVLYAPWMLPTTTILPSQLLRIKSQEQDSQRAGLLKLGKELRRMREHSEEIGLDFGGVRGLQPELVTGLCRALNLGTAAPVFWLRRRLSRRLCDVEAEDALLRRDMTKEPLEIEEQRTTLLNRGFLALRTPSDDLPNLLNAWLSRHHTSTASTDTNSTTSLLHKSMIETIFENARELERKRKEVEEVD